MYGETISTENSTSKTLNDQQNHEKILNFLN